MNVYERRAIQLAKQRARDWERSYGVRVTVNPPLLTVHFPDREMLRFRFRWSPAVEWLTEDRMALDKVPGLYVREEALAMLGAPLRGRLEGK